jgi:hypothetical protein
MKRGAFYVGCPAARMLRRGAANSTEATRMTLPHDGDRVYNIAVANGSPQSEPTNRANKKLQRSRMIFRSA